MNEDSKKPYSKKVQIDQPLPIYQPVTDLELVELCEKMTSDDKEEGIIARNRLIEANVRLAYHIAGKFENTGMEFDDLAIIACFGLIKAAMNFDINKKVKFATYASKCMENEILMSLRRKTERCNPISLQDVLNVDYEGNELHLIDILSDPNIEVADPLCDAAELSERKEILKTKLRHLPPIWRNVLVLIFGLNDGIPKTQKEVAEILQLSQSYISRIEKKALIKLRKDITREEIERESNRPAKKIVKKIPTVQPLETSENCQ